MQRPRPSQWVPPLSLHALPAGANAVPHVLLVLQIGVTQTLVVGGQLAAEMH
jgi:hypothetical protein